MQLRKTKKKTKQKNNRSWILRIYTYLHVEGVDFHIFLFYSALETLSVSFLKISLCKSLTGFCTDTQMHEGSESPL